MVLCVFLIYGGTVSLLKHFFQNGFCLWLVSYLKFTFGDNFAIYVMLCRLICPFMLIFFLHFCLGISDDGDLLVNVEFVCFFCIQESIMCVMDSNQILFYVTSLDLLVHSTSMVNGM